MSRAQEINEKLSWAKIKQALKGKITWKALALLAGLGMIYKAYKIAKTPVKYITNPTDYVPKDFTQRVISDLSRKNHAEAVREFEKIIRKELIERGLYHD